jgi:hypothetical protein
MVCRFTGIYVHSQLQNHLQKGKSIKLFDWVANCVLAKENSLQWVDIWTCKEMERG